jgi:type I restriction enzyme S subunit
MTAAVKPGFKQTEAGVIPEDWKVRGLLTVVSIANGQVDPRSEPYRSMILVAPDHITSGTGTLIAKHTAGEQGAISGKYVFNAGDVIYSKIRPHLRKAILADFNGLCSADMYPLRPGTDVIGGYILPIVLAQRFTTYATSVSARSGMPKINRTELAGFSVPLPPLPEQQLISLALDDADRLLVGMDCLIAKTKDFKHAVERQLLTGRTRLPGFRDKWKTTRLGNHLSILRNGTNARADLRVNGTVHYLHYGDIHGCSDAYITPDSLPFLPAARAESLDRLQDGDLIFADASEDIVGVSKSVEIRGSEGRETVAGLHTIAVRFDKQVLADGFKGYLQHCPPFCDHLRRFAAGTKVLATNRAHIASAELPLPSLAEQTAIASVLSDMDVEIAALERRRDKTKQLKQSMMQELLTGRTRLV